MGFFHESGNRLQKALAPRPQTSRKNNEKKPRVIEADRAVVLAFMDLQHAYALQCACSGPPPHHVQKFERQAWNRLMRYLTRLELGTD
jgi:hypothetical protein